MSKTKLFNFRIKENSLNTFKKICEIKGENMTEVLKKFIQEYINKNNHLLEEDEDTLTIFTNLEGSFKNYKIVLTKQDLKEINNEAFMLSAENNSDFEDAYRHEKIYFTIRKLIKSKLGERFSFLRQGSGLFQVVEDGYLLEYFNLFVFDKNGDLVEGNAFDLATITSLEKGENNE
jgi:hypothetical protein